jgi:hypothetical protein
MPLKAVPHLYIFNSLLMDEWMDYGIFNDGVLTAVVV